LIVQIEDWLGAVWAFIVGQPVLFVLVTGLIVALSSVITEIITYWLARVGGRALVERFSRWLKVDLRHMDRAESMFQRWGVGLVMFGRILPGVRTLVSVPAGMTRMNSVCSSARLLAGRMCGIRCLWQRGICWDSR
jgi:membrane protein DedA with SNARE-associated domain